MFKGFKPQAMEKIANKMGYQGSMQNFDNYLQQNPEKQREMIVYEQQAMKMARGGSVGLQVGGQVQPRQLSQTFTPDAKSTKGKEITDVTVDRLTDPGLPTGAKVIPVGTKIEKGQTVATGTGEVEGDVTAGTTKAEVEKADTITDEDRKKEVDETKTVESEAVSD